MWCDSNKHGNTWHQLQLLISQTTEEMLSVFLSGVSESLQSNERERKETLADKSSLSPTVFFFLFQYLNINIMRTSSVGSAVAVNSCWWQKQARKRHGLRSTLATVTWNFIPTNPRHRVKKSTSAHAQGCKFFRPWACITTCLVLTWPSHTAGWDRMKSRPWQSL